MENVFCADRNIGIVQDERDGGCAIWNSAPLNGRRQVGVAARHTAVFGRDCSTVGKGRNNDFERRGDAATSTATASTTSASASAVLSGAYRNE